MGKLIPGVLGTASGKVGDVTIANVKGISILRKNRRASASASEAQIIQRTKFGYVQAFLSPFSDLLQITFPKKDMATGHNNAAKHVLTEAVVGEYPDFRIDFSLLRIAKGKLEEPHLPNVIQNGLNLDFTWTPNVDEGNAKATDKVVLLAICPDKLKAKFSIGAADRAAGKASMDVTTCMGKPVHVYVAFVSANKRVASHSQYLGIVALA